MTAGSESLLSRLDLACEPSATRFARAHARDAFLKWGIPRGVLDDALLIVAELATNAVRHAGGQAAPSETDQGRPRVRRCALVLCVVNAGLCIAFHDEGDRPPVLRQGPSLEENGRGLQLVAGLTEGAWGWRPLAPEPGKSVWATIAIPEHWHQPRRPVPGGHALRPAGSQELDDPQLGTHWRMDDRRVPAPAARSSAYEHSP
jgi:serine/threonine-protein kinase RsbW